MYILSNVQIVDVCFQRGFLRVMLQNLHGTGGIQLKNKPKFCKYCNPDIDYALNPEGMPYSGIEMRVLGYVGILRCRIFECADFEKNFTTQDAVNINYCPMCGRSFNDENAG